MHVIFCCAQRSSHPEEKTTQTEPVDAHSEPPKTAHDFGASVEPASLLTPPAPPLEPASAELGASRSGSPSLEPGPVTPDRVAELEQETSTATK